jgi:hypothetical protein
VPRSTVVASSGLGPQRPGGASQDRAWIVALCAIWPIGLFVAVWALSGFGGNGTATAVAWIGLVVGIAMVLIATHVANRCSTILRFVCASLSVGAMVGLLYATQANMVTSAKLQLNASSWHRSMSAVDLRGAVDNCETIPPGRLSFKSFGEVTRACGTNATSEFAPSVEFLGTHPGTNLIFYPHAGMVPGADDCVAHITGPWWQTVTAGPSDCPGGFQFVGGA